MSNLFGTRDLEVKPRWETNCRILVVIAPLPHICSRICLHKNSSKWHNLPFGMLFPHQSRMLFEEAQFWEAMYACPTVIGRLNSGRHFTIQIKPFRTDSCDLCLQVYRQLLWIEFRLFPNRFGGLFPNKVRGFQTVLPDKPFPKPCSIASIANVLQHHREKLEGCFGWVSELGNRDVLPPVAVQTYCWQ